MPYRFNPLSGELDYYQSSSSTPSVYITEGASGISSIQWESDTGSTVWTMQVDDTGHVVTTAVVSGTTLRLLENGSDSRLTEGGDSRVQEG